VKERHLPDPKPVVVDQREQRPIAQVSDRGEERPDFELGQVTGQALIGSENPGQRREKVRE
jgi:hypothetical protein